MIRRLARRSAVLAAAATLAFAGSAFADSLAADGDALESVQNVVDLGVAAPGETIERDVTLVLFCGGIRHVDPGQVVTASHAGGVVPEQGGSINATSTTVGPVPAAWANDTAGASGCSGPMQVNSNGPSHVTIVAPPVPGLDYAFSVEYARSIAPPGVTDATSVTGFTIITFIVDVEEAGETDTTPPTLAGVPDNMEILTSDPAGVVLEYTPPTATDDLDPSPVVACDPPPGAVAPLGSTTVVCTATDASGNLASRAFGVMVRLAAVAWEDPVHGSEVTATRGRNLPLKARAWMDGAVVMKAGSFVVRTCDAGAVLERSIDAGQSDAGRWMAGLDTSGLASGCHQVALVVDGATLGSFSLQLVDPPAAGTNKSRAGSRPG